jgi:AcrR family transcriptional regulator
MTQLAETVIVVRLHPMPRHFTEQERERIRAALLEAGRDQLSRVGLRRTSVEDVARAAGIAKGAFYGFFESKEALVFAVALEVEQELRAELLAEFASIKGDARAHVVRLLRKLFALLAGHPILRILTDPAEGPAFLRTVDEAQRQALQEDDEAFYGDLIRRWRKAGVPVRARPRTLAAFARALFSLSLQRDFIGEDALEDVVELVIQGVASQMTMEKNTLPGW